MKKVIKFNDGQITVELNSVKSVRSQGDVENNTTYLVIPGLPTNLAQANSRVSVTPPALQIVSAILLLQMTAKVIPFWQWFKVN